MTPPSPAVTPPTPPVRVRSSRDLLSVVPYALGYQPAECLLVICIRDDGELGLFARTDLGDLRSARSRAEVAELVAVRAAQDSTAVAYVVVYTAGDAGPGSAAHSAARTFGAVLDEHVPQRESWVVGPRAYWSLDCADPACCPPDGFPLEMLESTVPGAQLVLEGRAPLPTREALYRVPRAPAEKRALVRRAADRWARARVASEAGEGAAPDATVAPRSATAVGEREWRSQSYCAWLDAVDKVRRRRELPAALLGRLTAGLAHREVRDGVLLWFVPGYEALAAATAAGAPADAVTRAEADARTSQAIAAVVDCETSQRPDRDRVQAANTVLEAVVAHAARERTASPLTLLAFLAWWSGEGSRATFRAAEALAVDPEHRLASLLASALRAGLPPGWVRSRTNDDVSRSAALDLG